MLSFQRKYIVHGFHFTQNFQHLLLYSTATSKATTKSLSNYLINSLGFSDKEALVTCTKFPVQKVNDFKFYDNAISVIHFLEQHGFDDTHLKKSICSYPILLCAKVDKTLKPKIKLLQDQGFSGSEISRVISVYPRILHAGLESRILPAIQVLRQIMGTDFDVVSVITKFQWYDVGYVVKNLLPNVDLLKKRGTPIEVIRKQLLWKPGTFLKKPDAFEDLVNKLGFARGSSRYMYGITLLSGYTEATIDSKCRLFKSFGWDMADIATVLVKNTCFVMLSDEKIKNKLEFLMNELRLEPAYLISHSALLTCSLEKRLMPRHKVLQILKDKQLIAKTFSFYSAICMSDRPGPRGCHEGHLPRAQPWKGPNMKKKPKKKKKLKTQKFASMPCS
ncbi:uncharacterized protein LOC141647574 [Silene latifolia]|uniref:uncharacterized protein LOC141647574 n=1 Tax=Silene latifolia TaxID=37657 RepID=UPI003D7876D8